VTHGPASVYIVLRILVYLVIYDSE
jgi:hypothetical protein